MRKNEHLIASLLKAIGFLGILYVIIYLAVNLCSCDKESFPWNSQPHLRGAQIVEGDIPPVVGRWNPPAIKTVGIDPIIYNASDNADIIPLFIGPACRADTESVLNETFEYLKQFNINYSFGSNPDILVKFFYGPWGNKSISSSTNLCGGIHLLDKTTSTLTVPKAEWNYIGLTNVKRNGKRYESCIVWINVFAYHDFKQQQENNPKIKMDWKKSSKNYMIKALNHEFGHTYGLNDDSIGTTPGLMSYRNMSLRPSKNEEDVIRWLYK